MKRYKISGEWVSKGETISVDEVEMVFAADHDAAIADLTREVEQLREALAYALSQHEQPHLFSPMHNHWSAKARAALSGKAP